MQRAVADTELEVLEEGVVRQDVQGVEDIEVQTLRQDEGVVPAILGRRVGGMGWGGGGGGVGGGRWRGKPIGGAAQCRGVRSGCEVGACSHEGLQWRLVGKVVVAVRGVQRGVLVVAEDGGWQSVE